METTIKNYLGATSQKDALSYLSKDFRLYFYSKDSDGISKDQMTKLMEWDYALNPEHQILALKREGDTLAVKVFEQNDFSKALDFPGWTATLRCTFNKEGLIKEQVYIPDPERPDYRRYLEPAISWLNKHRPEELEQVYDMEKGTMIQNKETASKWVELLEIWKNETGE